jgi:hypothetical protein
VDVAVITRETMANDLINELTTKLVEARKIIKKLELENSHISHLAGFYLSENKDLRRKLEAGDEMESEERRALVLS